MGIQLRNIIVGLSFLAVAFCANAAQMKVRLDANGGKVTTATIVVSDDDDGAYGELPVPTALGGKEFDGWWTAKTGGIKVAEGDAVDFSIFANPKSPVLYAQWLQDRQITVGGGYLEDGSTFQSVWPGDRVDVYSNEAQLFDKNGNMINAFGSWSVSPSGLDLGEDFNPFYPEATVTMPNADVKLTANYVNGVAAYLSFGYETRGDAEPGDFYWSVDGGKTLVPFGNEYPVKAGNVTVKFYDKSGLWHAPADIKINVAKRDTYKDGAVTYYEDPMNIGQTVTFVAVEGSYRVTFNANGGKTDTTSIWCVEGEDYSGLPVPARSGYVFAGWRTDKTGGELVREGDYCEPGVFEGQSEPTLYADWLKISKLSVKGSGAYASWSWSDEQKETLPESVLGYEYVFETGYQGVVDVPAGATVRVEGAIDAVDSAGNDLAFQKWSVDPGKTDLGREFMVTEFKTSLTMPAENLTLTANYVNEATCGYLSAEALADYMFLEEGEDGEDICIYPPYGSFEWSPDGGKTWYKSGTVAMLKAGKHNISWRSMDANWLAPEAKTEIRVAAGDEIFIDSGVNFTFVPQVVVDIILAGEELQDPGIAGTVTMGSASGAVPAGKTLTLTAKAAKGYVFQGWAFAKYWNYGNRFQETATSWKIENSLRYDETYLEEFIGAEDGKVHVVAVFKALADYSADDIAFNGLEGRNYKETYPDADGNANVDIYAMAGCALDDEYELVCDPAASPLVFKTVGSIPAGLKFDAKKGTITGTPTKAGEYSFTVVATDSAKHAKSLTVNVIVLEMTGEWLAGDYRAMTSEENWLDNPWAEGVTQNGILELSVSSSGKVAAKLLTCLGTRSCSGVIAWSPDYDDPANGAGEFFFRAAETKDEEECMVRFYEDGTINGYADSYSKANDDWIGGIFSGMRQDKELLAQSSFIDKYYTFAFCAARPNESGDIDESAMSFGYGYLTLKTDKKGAVKVAGQLPDGEKVSMSALLLPVADDGNVTATLHVFTTPSSYGKEDWFAMTLCVLPDGSVETQPNAAWTIASNGYGYGDEEEDVYDDEEYEGDQAVTIIMGFGAEYSTAQTLQNYYWTISCENSDRVLQEYSWKGMALDDSGKAVSYTDYDYASALGFNGYLFNVAVMGNSKGAISLAAKSPAPWNNDGEWNYAEDKKGNQITDPSQLSISFAKATGIFTGKATVYFDYGKPTYKKNARTGEIDVTWAMQHDTAALPYSGVMVIVGENNYVGLGSALYAYKFTEIDAKGKANALTKKVSLPVSMVNED